MAQYRHAAFGYGTRTTTIDIVDGQGVLTAAVRNSPAG